MVPRVFISYRRENDLHIGRVRLLAAELKRRGLAVAFDEYFLAEHPAGPDQGWGRWCIDQARDSACVLMVGSTGYYAALEKKAVGPTDLGLGAAAEANVIQAQLYQQKWITSRHRIVLLDAADATGLPIELSELRRFSPRTSTTDLDDLARWAADLCQGSGGGAAPAPASDGWPSQPPVFAWPMADHHGVREAVGTLLTRGAPWRFVPVKGPSETGKSHITRQLLANALTLPDLACGRFDFKGTTNMDVEVRALVQDLGVPVPDAALRLNERLGQILDSLRVRARPALLIFDTYEAAGEARDWVEKQLLPTLVRATWLRVFVAGQLVPNAATTVWGNIARPTIQLTTPGPEDWLEYGKGHKPDLTLAQVTLVHQLSQGKASLLSQLLGPTA